MPMHQLSTTNATPASLMLQYKTLSQLYWIGMFRPLSSNSNSRTCTLSNILGVDLSMAVDIIITKDIGDHKPSPPKQAYSQQYCVSGTCVVFSFFYHPTPKRHPIA